MYYRLYNTTKYIYYMNRIILFYSVEGRKHLTEVPADRTDLTNTKGTMHMLCEKSL